MPAEQTFQISLAGIDTPRLDEYFGVWAILEEPFRQACRVVEGLDLRQHIAASGEKRLEKLSARTETVDCRTSANTITTGAIGVIDLRGPLMKQSSSLSGGTSTVAARQAIRAAAADPEISAILLRIDSPGGSAAGTAELANEVRAAAKKKTTWAYIEDLGASAAYWVASQASRVITNPTGMVGSIGTFMVMHDLSAMAEKEGVKVHVIRAGEYKGAGTPGTEVTEAQIAHYQGIVDSLNEHFLRAVADGRSMPLKQVRELADGRVHVGQAAKSLGLVDAVESFDETLQNLSKERKGSPAMTDANPTGNNTGTNPVQTAPAAATYDEIVAGCGGLDPQNGDDAKFVIHQLSTKATQAQAQQAWMSLQKERADAATQELAELKAQQKTGNHQRNPEPPSRPGVPPVSAGTGKSADADARATVEELVTAEMAAGKPRHEAFRSVMKKNPGLRADLIAAANS